MNDATKPKRYQCRHIFVDGTRCGSPCLRGEDFCYYRHTIRKPIPNPTERQSRRAAEKPASLPRPSHTQIQQQPPNPNHNPPRKPSFRPNPERSEG
jgi:hypothetical protein